MNATYDQTGNYLVIGGVIASILAHYNIVISASDISSIIIGGVILVGAIKQFVSHKNLAVATGSYHKE